MNFRVIIRLYSFTLFCWYSASSCIILSIFILIIVSTLVFTSKILGARSHVVFPFEIRWLSIPLPQKCIAGCYFIFILVPFLLLFVQFIYVIFCGVSYYFFGDFMTTRSLIASCVFYNSLLQLVLYSCVSISWSSSFGFSLFISVVVHLWFLSLVGSIFLLIGSFLF